MGRARLIRSITILVLLYGGGGLLWFSLMPPAQVQTLIARLPEWMQVQAMPDAVSVFDAASWQIDLLIMWSLPVFLAWCAILCVGIGIAWFAVHVVGKTYEKRTRPGLVYRGCQLTYGDLILPSLPNKIEPLDVRIKGLKFSRAQQALANDALGLIAGAGQSYAGDGHGVSLYEHTVNILKQVAAQTPADPELALAAIAHDMGKIVAYRKIGDAWQITQDHGLASGRLLRMLPAFEGLDREQAEAIHAAVRYSHQPDQMPTNLPDTERATRLMNDLKKIDGQTTAEEKSRLIESRDLTAEVEQAFWDNFSNMVFYRKNMAYGTRSVGWSKGNRIYFNEHALREWLQRRMERDLAAALGRIRRSKQIHPLTETLMKALHDKGMLVTEAVIDDKRYRLPARAALWRIKSGSSDFNGVFVVEFDKSSNMKMPTPAPFTIYPSGTATDDIEAMAEISDAQTDEVIKPSREPVDRPDSQPRSKKGSKKKSGKRKQGQSNSAQKNNSGQSNKDKQHQPKQNKPDSKAAPDDKKSSGKKNASDGHKPGKAKAGAGSNKPRRKAGQYETMDVEELLGHEDALSDTNDSSAKTNDKPGGQEKAEGKPRAKTRGLERARQRARASQEKRKAQTGRGQAGQKPQDDPEKPADDSAAPKQGTNTATPEESAQGSAEPDEQAENPKSPIKPSNEVSNQAKQATDQEVDPDIFG